MLLTVRLTSTSRSSAWTRVSIENASPERRCFHSNTARRTPSRSNALSVPESETSTSPRGITSATQKGTWNCARLSTLTDRSGQLINRTAVKSILSGGTRCHRLKYPAHKTKQPASQVQGPRSALTQCDLENWVKQRAGQSAGRWLKGQGRSVLAWTHSPGSANTKRVRLRFVFAEPGNLCIGAIGATRSVQRQTEHVSRTEHDPRGRVETRGEGRTCSSGGGCREELGGAAVSAQLQALRPLQVARHCNTRTTVQCHVNSRSWTRNVGQIKYKTRDAKHTTDFVCSK